jgi:hypothetical protein
MQKQVLYETSKESYEKIIKFSFSKKLHLITQVDEYLGGNENAIIWLLERSR